MTQTHYTKCIIIVKITCSHTHTHKFLKKIADKYGDDVRMTGYRPIKLLGQRDRNLGLPSSKLFLQATTDVFTYDMHKLNIQRGSVWPYDTSPERTDWLNVAYSDKKRSDFYEISRLLRNPNIRYTVQKIQPPVSVNYFRCNFILCGWTVKMKVVKRT
jgi:hypothetical protein